MKKLVYVLIFGVVLAIVIAIVKYIESVPLAEIKKFCGYFRYVAYVALALSITRFIKVVIFDNDSKE